MSTTIRLKNKQYNIKIGEIVKVDRINYQKNQIVNIEEGISYRKELNSIKRVNVIAVIVEHNKENKNTVFKKKRRKNYRRTIRESKKITFIEIKKII